MVEKSLQELNVEEKWITLHTVNALEFLIFQGSLAGRREVSCDFNAAVTDNRSSSSLLDPATFLQADRFMAYPHDEDSPCAYTPPYEGEREGTHTTFSSGERELSKVKL